MTHLRLVALHGIGKNTPPTFADKAMGRLTKGLAAYGVTSSWASVPWGTVLDGPERQLLEDSKRLGSEGRLIQRISIGTLADALKWSHYAKAIYELVDSAVARTGSSGRLVFVGHSLGCWLTLNYLEARPDLQDAQVHAVFTGCNVPLFIGPDYVPPAGLDRAGRLVCAFDPDDGIGWPCRTWAPAATDIKVEVGSWFTGWTGISHTAYWNDKELWAKTLPPVVRTFAR